MVGGSGQVRASTGAFAAGVRFPSLRGEPEGSTSPEELLAASHASCYGIGLGSVLARHGGSASRVLVTATITAEKGPEGIRVRESHLSARIEGLRGIAPADLAWIGAEAEQGCTISNALRSAVAITCEIVAMEGARGGPDVLR